MRNFLSRHPALQYISLAGYELCRPTRIADDSLPKPHSLKWQEMEKGGLKETSPESILPSIKAANIRHLSTDVTPTWLPVITQMKSLETWTLRISPDHLPLVLNALPASVERIDLTPIGAFGVQEYVKKRPELKTLMYGNLPFFDSKYDLYMIDVRGGGYKNGIRLGLGS
ncbi:hypothetical protein M422DRAFT_246917 [Sphaerobolus stellatus SS14]|nr:hypothetical protein M422DRAFT_246917 [Sphaerobolus stellatus SS14]